jgi:acyl-CoA reductase-like NAD-dependent aldehyde dehydrogenase
MKFTFVNKIFETSPTQKVPLKERMGICEKFVEAMESMRENIAEELTMQMGRYVIIFAVETLSLMSAPEQNSRSGASGKV